MVAVYQKNQIRAFAQQTAADTNVTLTIPLPPLTATQAIKVTHITFIVDASGVALWAAAGCYLLAVLSDAVRQIATMSFSVKGGAGYVNCIQEWDDQDGFFTAQDNLSLVLATGATGVTNIVEASIFFDIVTVTESNRNLLLLGKAAVQVG